MDMISRGFSKSQQVIVHLGSDRGSSASLKPEPSHREQSHSRLTLDVKCSKLLLWGCLVNAAKLSLLTNMLSLLCLVNQRFLTSHCRKNSARDKVTGKKGTQRETHSTDRVWAILEGERPPKYSMVSFYVLSNLIANKWEDYSNYFGEEIGISRNWATVHFLTFYGWPQNCHGAGGCVTQPLLTYYNACLMRPRVYWKSNLLPSWIWLVVTSFHHILRQGHSFKGYILPPFHLFVSFPQASKL